MIPTLAGIAAALALAAVIWFAAPTRLGFRRARGLRREARRLTDGQQPVDHEFGDVQNLREAAVIRDAERALVQARQEARAIVAEAEARAAQVHSAAERDGRAIIAAARDQADELVELAELKVTDAEQRAAHEREAADRTRRVLTQMLRDLLAEVTSPPAAGAANVYTLDPQRAEPQRSDEAQ
jgi:cell division septum initiation protein DivIVA